MIYFIFIHVKYIMQTISILNVTGSGCSLNLTIIAGFFDCLCIE